MEIRFKDGEFSNFCPSRFYLDGHFYDSVEMYFQSKKFLDEEYASIIRSADSPMKTKLLGTQNENFRFSGKWVVNKVSDKRKINDVIREYKEKGIKIRDGWDDLKVDIMYEGLIEKFGQNKNLCSKLVKTMNAELIEVNPRDYFWAEGANGTGQNMLGVLLMKVRDYYTA